MTDKLISIKLTLRRLPDIDLIYCHFVRTYSGEIYVGCPGTFATGAIRRAFQRTGQGAQSLVGNMIDPDFRQLTENEWDAFCDTQDIRPAYRVNDTWLPIREF
jgi:hypothetical protein